MAGLVRKIFDSTEEVRRFENGQDRAGQSRRRSRRAGNVPPRVGPPIGVPQVREGTARRVRRVLHNIGRIIDDDHRGGRLSRSPYVHPHIRAFPEGLKAVPKVH